MQVIGGFTTIQTLFCSEHQTTEAKFAEENVDHVVVIIQLKLYISKKWAIKAVRIVNNTTILMIYWHQWSTLGRLRGVKMSWDDASVKWSTFQRISRLHHQCCVGWQQSAGVACWSVPHLPNTSPLHINQSPINITFARGHLTPVLWCACGPLYHYTLVRVLASRLSEAQIQYIPRSQQPVIKANFTMTNFSGGNFYGCSWVQEA